MEKIVPSGLKIVRTEIFSRENQYRVLNRNFRSSLISNWNTSSTCSSKKDWYTFLAIYRIFTIFLCKTRSKAMEWDLRLWKYQYHISVSCAWCFSSLLIETESIVWKGVDFNWVLSTLSSIEYERVLNTHTKKKQNSKASHCL